MKRRLPVLGIAAAVATLLCACSFSDSAEPEGQPPAFPPRPIIIDVDKVSPCAMLSETQRSSLSIISAQSRVSDVEGIPSEACGFLGRSGLDYNTQIIPADAAVAKGLPNAQVILVNGFGAIQNIPVQSLGPTPMCQIAVDAADGQTIRVQAFTTPGTPLLGDPELCRRASDAASMMMTTVVATASR